MSRVAASSAGVWVKSPGSPGRQRCRSQPFAFASASAGDGMGEGVMGCEGDDRRGERSSRIVRRILDSWTRVVRRLRHRAGHSGPGTQPKMGGARGCAMRKRTAGGAVAGGGSSGRWNSVAVRRGSSGPAEANSGVGAVRAVHNRGQKALTGTWWCWAGGILPWSDEGAWQMMAASCSANGSSTFGTTAPNASCATRASRANSRPDGPMSERLIAGSRGACGSVPAGYPTVGLVDNSRVRIRAVIRPRWLYHRRYYPVSISSWS